MGIILLSHKNRKSRISADDVAFLAALASVASIAIKNSMLYEQAYREAVTDEPDPGLYNRKHFNAKMEELFLLQKILPGAGADQRGRLQALQPAVRHGGGRQGPAAHRQGHHRQHWGKRRGGQVQRQGICNPAAPLRRAGRQKLTESISRQIYSLNESGGEYSIKRLTISAGISAYPYGASTPKELLDNVDLSVYHAKRSGKNAIRVFDTTVNGVKNWRNPARRSTSIRNTNPRCSP